MSRPRFLLSKLRPLQLAAVIFLTVSGGPYGLEVLLGYAGTHAALLFILITPWIWDLPSLLAVLELNSMMPVTGGYYQWVRRALGERLGFYEGWWTWLYTFADLAIYPVLFVEYLGYFFPQATVYKVPICLAIVWIAVLLNILGIVSVGRSSVLLSALVLVPFAALLLAVLGSPQVHLSIPRLSFRGLPAGSAGLALYAVMWNFLGWDNATTYAEEVEHPVRSYLLATGMAFAGVYVLYLGSMYLAQVSLSSLPAFVQDGFPALGTQLGKPWLARALAFGGMASTLGIFSAVLLSVTRIPKSMAEDGLLPGLLARSHPRLQTPYVSILVCGSVVSLMILWTFSDLLIIDVLVYGAGLMLEFASLLVLRLRAPGQQRPFRIPLSTPALALMLLLPVLVFLAALWVALQKGSGTLLPIGFAFALLASAEPAFLALRSLRRRRHAGAET